MKRFLSTMVVLGWPALGQQPSLVPIPVSNPVVIAADTQGGVYVNGTTGGKPAILHFTSAGELRSLVKADDVGHGELYHSPWDLWLNGDGTRVLFPVFQHVAEFHAAEVMQFQDGKITPLLTIDQKLRIQRSNV
jgi:hypothetical protein